MTSGNLGEALCAMLIRHIGPDNMRFRRLTALAIAFALRAPLFAVDETTPPMAAAVVEQMNCERAAHGLKPLKINEELRAAALDRIDDMFAKHYFSHTSPDGIQPWEWADKRGYDYRQFGENLAVGYPTAEAV